LHFDSNGGSGAASDQEVTFAQNMPALSNLPERNGYVFNGYYDAAQWGVQYYGENGNSAKIWDKDISAQTLYAQWRGELYRITYKNMLAGVFSEPDDGFYVGSGLELVPPRHNEYTFAGYYLDSLFSGSPVTSILPNEIGDKVFYCKWTYRVEYNLNGGTGTALSATVHIYNSSDNIIYPVPSDWTKVGADACLGWSTDKDAVAAEFSRDGGSAVGLLVNPVVRLYAVWRASTSRVILQSGNVTGGLAVSNPEVTATYGSSMPVLTELPQRDGYIFAGYYDMQEGGTQYYASNGSGVQNWDKTASEVILYARWLSERADNLTGLFASDGTLSPAFAPTVYEYNLALPCNDVTLNLTYPQGNVVKVNGQTVQTSYTVAAFPSYDVLQIEVGAAGKASVVYTVRLNAPLSSDNIVYNPEASPNQMSISDDFLNNPLYELYQWYVDGSLIADKYSGILEISSGFTAGAVYSVVAYTNVGNEVRVCGVTARAVASNDGSNEPTLVVSPNPSNTDILVSHSQLGEEATTVRIYSMSGSLVLSYPVAVGDGNSVLIDISMLAPGQYIIKVFNSTTQITKQ
jgi:hypothetical protein